MNSVITAIARSRRIHISEGAKAVCLFCLLGLAISAAILPLYEAGDVDWTVANLDP